MRAALLALLLAAPALAQPLTLHYTRPAEDWQSQALPIGNGRLGAMIFGGAAREHLQLNEISLWTGDEKDTGRYQNLADLFFDLDHGAATGYRRALNISTATHTTAYAAGGVAYTREYLASAPNQVLALFERPVFNPGGLEDTISLVLDGIQDPGNLGTIIRIADWFGLAHIICSHETADAFNIKTIQSSMGSISRVEVRYEELGAFLDSHKHLPAYAATLSGTSIYEVDRISCGLILIGNESRGISEELLRRVSHHITIPGAGHAESLNAAVASGIILSHLVQG